jgi:hypothetical protein
MTQVQHFNLIGNAKRHHRRARLKDPTLPAYVNGAGKVVANGSSTIELPLEDGSTISYSAMPATQWRFVKKTSKKATSPRQFVDDNGVLAPLDALLAVRTRAELEALLALWAQARRPVVAAA